MPEALIGARAVHFASTAMVFGVTLFRFQIAEAAFRQAGASVLAAKTNYLRELSWIFSISLALAVFSGAMWLVLLAANISNEPISVAVSDGTLWTVLTQTQIGFVWIVRLILAALLASWLLLVNPNDKSAFRSGWPPIFCAAFFMGSLAWSGHAGGTPGIDGDIHVASDFLHLIAAGAWLGGLLPLTLLLASARYAQDPSTLLLLRAATFRFSTVGLIAVGTLLATGIVNAAIYGWQFACVVGNELRKFAAREDRAFRRNGKCGRRQPAPLKAASAERRRHPPARSQHVDRDWPRYKHHRHCKRAWNSSARRSLEHAQS